MKTSNKLLAIALLIIVGSLFFYDLSVRAVYRSGSFRIPFRDYSDLNFKDFDTINVKSCTAVNVLFQQGPFHVKMAPGAESYARIGQDGKTLNIGAVFKHGFENNRNPYLVIVTCPNIAKLSTDGWYGTNGKSYIDTVVKDDWNMRKVWVEGFKQDSLTISQDFGSTVVLSGNAIKALNAQIGKSPLSGSKLFVLKNNHFESANLDIRNKSKLLLEDADIGKLNYRLSDSAKLVLNGNAAHLINK